MSQLVLSLFPGIGLLDMGFELEGFCVVRGPDLLWGGDIRNFHPPAGKFDGVIGGPPCQPFSRMRAVFEAQGYRSRFDDLIPDFERCVEEAAPLWFVMENIQEAPIPHVIGYEVFPSLLNNRWLGEAQNRVHRFSFGMRGRMVHLRYELAALESAAFEPRVCSDQRTVPIKLLADGKKRHSLPKDGPTRSVEDLCESQGLPRKFFAHSPFTKKAQRSMLGNGVPLSMGCAFARAVKAAIAEVAASA